MLPVPIVNAVTKTNFDLAAFKLSHTRPWRTTSLPYKLPVMTKFTR